MAFPHCTQHSWTQSQSRAKIYLPRFRIGTRAVKITFLISKSGLSKRIFLHAARHHLGGSIQEHKPFQFFRKNPPTGIGIDWFPQNTRHEHRTHQCFDHASKIFWKNKTCLTPTISTYPTYPSGLSFIKISLLPSSSGVLTSASQRSNIKIGLQMDSKCSQRARPVRVMLCLTMSHLDGNWDPCERKGASHVPAPRHTQDNHVKVATCNAATNHVDMPSLTEFQQLPPSMGGISSRLK